MNVPDLPTFVRRLLSSEAGVEGPRGRCRWSSINWHRWDAPWEAWEPLVPNGMATAFCCPSWWGCEAGHFQILSFNKIRQLTSTKTLAHSTWVQDVRSTKPTYGALLHGLEKYLQVSIQHSRFSKYRPGFTVYPPQLLCSIASCTVDIRWSQVTCREMSCCNHPPRYLARHMAEHLTDSLVLAQTSCTIEHTNTHSLYIFQVWSCQFACGCLWHWYILATGGGMKRQPPFG